MYVTMKVTGRSQNSHKSVHGSRAAYLATRSGEDVARQVRIRELRELVASGRYRPEPERLAREILRRAHLRSGTC